MHSHNITNPISSSQVTRVNLLKPDCLNVCGDSLNDWLKALAEKHCEVDWKSVDTSCLESLYGACSNDKSLKSIVELLINSVCTLTTVNSGCTESADCNCSGNIQEAVLPLLERWDNQNPLNRATVYLKDNFVTLKGRISGGSTLVTIANLPVDFRPAYERRVPFAHSFNLPNTSNEHPFLRISTNGNIDIVWVGTAPSTSLNGDIYLDGITFVKN